MSSPPNCTLTTCCFNLTKYNPEGARSASDSIASMESLLEVPCYLVIYTDAHFYEMIKKKRDDCGLGHLTRYTVIDVEELDSFKYLDKVRQNRTAYHPTKDARTCAETHLVCSSKFELVLRTISANPFGTAKFGWIDANVGVNFAKICTGYKPEYLLNILEGCSSDKFSLQILDVCDKALINEDRLREYYSTYRWIVCGCLFITGKEVGLTILNELNKVFIKHTMAGYGHGEEMYYLEILDKYYDKIERTYGDYKQIINNFIGITMGIEHILRVCNGYLDRGYNRECVDCCLKVIRQYENGAIEPFSCHHYFAFLYNCYVAAFYIDRRIASEMLQKIKTLIVSNTDAQSIYLSNKEFYDRQFAFLA